VKKLDWIALTSNLSLYQRSFAGSKSHRLFNHSKLAFRSGRPLGHYFFFVHFPAIAIHSFLRHLSPPVCHYGVCTYLFKLPRSPTDRASISWSKPEEYLQLINKLVPDELSLTTLANSDRFAKLKDLFIRVFCCPATTAPVERVFRKVD